MLKILAIAATVAVTMTGFAAPSMADDYGSDGYGYHKKRHHNNYQETYHEPVCHWKKIKFWDDYGNLRVKRVKVCN